MRGPVETLPFNGSLPRPLIVTEVALFVLQLKVDDPPAVMESGLALNMTTCGRPAFGFTVTIAVAVTLLPPELVAVKV